MIETIETEAGESAGNMIGRIPVRNIWLLMLYASDLYKELSPARRVAVEDNPHEIPDLAAEILTRSIERRLRRNLSFAFRTRKDVLPRIRGSIDLLQTERHQLLRRGKCACRYESLTVDTPRNRFVRAAVHRLARVVQKPRLVSRCRSVETHLERAGVSTETSFDHPRGRSGVAADLRGRMDPEDWRMMAAAFLAFNLALPTEDAGGMYLSSPDRDEIWARRLFEAAIGGFYGVVLSDCGWTTRTGTFVHWSVENATDGLMDLLPSMKTDIILERTDRETPSAGRRIVIDTKFTSILTPSRYRNEAFRSGYIFQIYAYLRSQERIEDPHSLDAAGMLLHPSVGGDVRESAVIQGHEIRFVTVDLAASSREIRNRLLDIVIG